MSNVPDITYILSRGNETYRFLKNFFAVGYIWNQYIKEKYYKGTESILYFPYINHDLKKCHAVKISTTYYRTTAGKLYVDGLLFWHLVQTGVVGNMTTFSFSHQF